MATLDNAVWFGTDGFAESGTTTISEGGNSTTVTGTFTNDAWDGNANGTGGVRIWRGLYHGPDHGQLPVFQRG